MAQAVTQPNTPDAAVMRNCVNTPDLLVTIAFMLRDLGVIPQMALNRWNRHDREHAHSTSVQNKPLKFTLNRGNAMAGHAFHA
jgi:hypothetical protein